MDQYPSLHTQSSLHDSLSTALNAYTQLQCSLSILIFQQYLVGKALRRQQKEFIPKKYKERIFSVSRYCLKLGSELALALAEHLTWFTQTTESYLIYRNFSVLFLHFYSFYYFMAVYYFFFFLY